MDVSYFNSSYNPSYKLIFARVYFTLGSFPGGEFPFCVSIVGLPSGMQTIVIGATDSADGAIFRSTITADIGSKFPPSLL